MQFFDKPTINLLYYSVKRYEILKTITKLHIAIIKSMCYSNTIPRKEVVTMKDKELRKLIGSRANLKLTEFPTGNINIV